MPTPTAPARREIIRRELAALDSPMLVDQVRRAHPVPLSIDGQEPSPDRAHDFVFLEEQTIAPLRIALQGLCFRVRLDREGANAACAWPGRRSSTCAHGRRGRCPS